MAASLLTMVCAITARSKKHEESKPELEKIRHELENLREELILLASEDARAYDLVVEAIKALKTVPGETAETALQMALKHASEVPMRTAITCLKVVECSTRVAELGTRSASSDVGVAVLLAESGFRGADMNVRINIKDIIDRAFVQSAQEKLKLQEEQVRMMASKAFRTLKGP